MTQLKERYSPEVNDLMNAPPPWMLSWGLWVILILLGFLLIGSYFFKYPEVVPARVTITTSNPPATILAKVNGKVDSVFVSNGQLVKKEDVLLTIENPTNYRDVKLLKTTLIKFSHWLFHNGDLPVFVTDNSMQLGGLQEYYSALVEDYNNYYTYINSTYSSDKLRAHQNQLDLSAIQLESLQTQISLLNRELKLSDKQLARDSMLFSQGVISVMEFETSKSKYLQKAYSYNVVCGSVSMIKRQIQDVHEQILDLQYSHTERLNILERSLEKKLNNLQSQISIWENLYVVEAPIDGEISFSKVYAAGLNTTLGETMINVIPQQSELLSVRAEASMVNAGKLEPGLKVNIKMDNYPYYEYGMLKGTVIKISKIADNSIYYLEIALDRGLETTLKKRLTLSQRMSGTAEVITKDRRLIERMVEPIRALIYK
jgi:multidrug resistance efflux pump